MTDSGQGARQTGTGRNASLEMLRLVAAFGIVWFHLRLPGARLAYAALPLFLVLTTYMSAVSLRRKPGALFLQDRIQRIAVPWVAWSAFYLLVNIEMSHHLIAELYPSSIWSLLIGPSIHLWFLPFTFLVGAALAVLVPRVRDRASALLLAAGLAGLGVLAMDLSSIPLPEPLPQWDFAIPGTAFGAILAVSEDLGLMLLPGGILAILIAAGIGVGDASGFGQLAVAVAVFLLARRFEFRSALAERLGNLSFGIYLVHPFCILVYFKLFDSAPVNWTALLVIFALSCAVTLAMTRLPYLRRLV